MSLRLMRIRLKMSALQLAVVTVSNAFNFQAMFWQNNEENSLDVLLKSDEISLNSVLDNPYTLQEIRNGNQSLVQ